MVVLTAVTAMQSDITVELADGAYALVAVNVTRQQVTAAAG